MNRIVFLFAILTFWASCSRAQKAELKDGTNHYGSQISAENAQDVSEVLTILGDKKETKTKLKGVIQEVCQSKGCWMTLSNGQSDQSVFIKFTDYAFFVPLNAGGKEAIVEGTLSSSITPVDELRHYAEDKGQSAEEIAAITEPKVELKMMVDGVIIFN